MGTINLIKTEDNLLTVTVRVERCSNCKKPMISDFSMVPYDWKHQLAAYDIRTESIYENRLCTVCIKEGGYSKHCDVCGTEHVFPNEFAYMLRFYPEFPEGETTRQYVCNWCVEYNGKAVVKLMGKADDIEEITHE